MPGIAAVLEQARALIPRVSVTDLPARIAAGAWVIDIRPQPVRARVGHVPGSVVVDRLVLEWRLDPLSPHRMRPGPGLDDEVYVLCNERAIRPAWRRAICRRWASPGPAT